MSGNMRKGLYIALVAGGLSVLGATTANAAETDGADGLLSGTQVVPVVTAPVTVGGNSIAVLGESSAEGTAPTEASTPAGGSSGTTDQAAAGSQTSGEDGLASGTQVVPVVTAPVTVGGNSIALLGESSAEGAAPAAPAEGSTGTTDQAAPGSQTSGEEGLVSGTQVVPVVTAPVTVGGNSIAVLGESTQASTPAEGSSTDSTDQAAAGSQTSGEEGLVSGTQVVPVVTAPVTVGGNSIAVLGESRAAGAAPAEGSTGTTDQAAAGSQTSGEDGLVSGTQVVPVVTAPIDLGGNSIAILSEAAVRDDEAPAEETPVDTDGGSFVPPVIRVTDPEEETDVLGPETGTSSFPVVGTAGTDTGIVLVSATVATSGAASLGGVGTLADGGVLPELTSLAPTGAPALAGLLAGATALIATGLALYRRAGRAHV